MARKPSTDKPDTLGQRTRAARKALGLTQEQTAERLGMSVEYYRRIESARGNPSVETLARMPDVLNVTADYLLGIDLANFEPPGSIMATLPADLVELIERIIEQDAVRLVRLLFCAVDERDRE